jgi:hypothetical protein
MPTSESPPTETAEEKLSDMLSVSVSPSFKKRVETAADKDHRSVSSFFRHYAALAADQILGPE